MCQSSQPVQQQQASTELPEWAKPYAKDILAKGQALTDVNQNPYQIYNQPRIAGFSPMQQQAMQGAAGMSVAPQIGAGSAYAAGAGLGGLDVAGQATTGGFQGQVGSQGAQGDIGGQGAQVDVPRCRDSAVPRR